MQNPRIKNTQTTVIAETTNSQQQNDAAQITNHDIPDESSQSLSQNQSVADLDAQIPPHACKCECGCSTRQCGCVNREIRCGQLCKCGAYGCQNQEETANSEEQSNAAQVTDESPQSLSQNQSAADLDTEISSHGCSCEAGCSTRQCGCVKREIRCGQRCKCGDYGCQNQEDTAISEQESNAAQVTNESSQSFSQNQSVADLDAEIPLHACKCECGCSTRQCGCVKREIRCGQRCKCGDYGCQNQEDTAISEQESNAAQVTDESSQSLSQNQSVADLDAEIPLHACRCECGCSTRQCGCVKREIRCGQRCKCGDYGCQNQEDTAISEQESNAAQVTDESSQSLSQNQSVADLDTEVPLHACKCECGCSTRQCGCVKREIRCGQRCKCGDYGCQNQEDTAISEQESNAAQVTDESSQSLSQNQSVADLDAEVPLHACKCECGCSTRQCGCVKREIRCGQRCKCGDYGCQNQEDTAISEQESNAAQVTDESSQSLSQNQSVADLDTEVPLHACKCECGCSTRQCGCVKREIRCGQRCKCGDYGCQNQEDTAISEQESNAAQVTDESPQSLSQNQSVADLNTEIPPFKGG